MNNELWKDVVGYEGLYKVSNHGNVHGNNGILLPQDSGQKLVVRLIKHGSISSKAVHRLVAEAFIPNESPDTKIQVNHIDNNHHNNTVENLEWCTPSENTTHAYVNGHNSKARRVHQYDLEGNYMATYYSTREAERVTGIAATSISGVAIGNRKTAGSYIWSYKMPREHVFMNFALDLANLSKCTQRGVAAIITDSKLMQVYSVGINGGPINGVDCLCAMHGKETCIHAETQAIAKMNVADNEKIMFTTLSPCITCASLIINNGFKKVYYTEDWKDNPGIKLLKAAGIPVFKI